MRASGRGDVPAPLGLTRTPGHSERPGPRDALLNAFATAQGDPGEWSVRNGLGRVPRMPGTVAEWTLASPGATEPGQRVLGPEAQRRPACVGRVRATAAATDAGTPGLRFILRGVRPLNDCVGRWQIRFSRVAQAE